MKTPAPLIYGLALMFAIDSTHTSNPIELWLALGIAGIGLVFQLNKKDKN